MLSVLVSAFFLGAAIGLLPPRALVALLVLGAVVLALLWWI